MAVTTLWQFEDSTDQGGTVYWKDQSEDWGKKLSELFNTLGSESIIKFVWPLELEEEGVTHCEYTIDFEKMTQTNHNTGRCRRIRLIDVRRG